MTFPDAILNYLQADFVRRRRPFCFLIDAEYRLRGFWGDAELHGFEELVTGENMLDRAPYILGHLGTTLDVLPFVTTASGGTVEVHILPGDACFHVVLMDSKTEHDFHQQRQQTANELRLLHTSQQTLIQQQRALIGELVEAKAELDHRRREAERTNASKSQFIAMMSHEFRTPLSSIINYADLALAKDTSVDNIRKSAEAIARASRHMNRLVDTVLDEAQLEAGRITLHERAFSLVALFDDIAAIMAPLAAEKGLSFGIYMNSDIPAHLLADDVCLRQILINLLGNAVKFTETGGVRLDVEWKQDQLSARVSDTGPGIAAVDQERIFQAFERAGDASRTNIPGAGLGLSLSLRLARLMRGDIELSSAPGEGCSVNLMVPALLHPDSVDEESALPEPDAEYRALRPATILLCDDDEDLLALAEYYLVRAGYGLLLARDGEEAVEKALAYHPDLVLMDINTPRLTGSAAAARLRAKGFAAPIIALTASDVRKLNSRDFTSSLRKPIQMPRLLAQIQSHV
ncbi:MAG: ATP-binding protein [Gammaproteobacteria bacterium]|nr:ATP-binding protein [Gammaproteobacteria bacterium]